ncbi:MAG: hypothetical protein GF421_10940 [Candidatus Aminicenantes bacterium]|nr:hypothetical protein [Candidatus Aminicenantes bacterium]
MKKSVVIFLVFAFVQFITVPILATDSRSVQSDRIVAQEFSLKTDYTSRINMKDALFSMSEKWVKDAFSMQETSEDMSLQEEIKSLKKKRSGYLIGSIALFAAAGVSVWRFTEVEPKKGTRAGAGETEGTRSTTTGMGKMTWVLLGAISAAVGVALISNYSKTNKEIKAKQKEMESLSRAQQRLARALSR